MKKKQLLLWLAGLAIAIALAIYAVGPLQKAARSFLLTEPPVLLSLPVDHFSLNMD